MSNRTALLIAAFVLVLDRASKLAVIAWIEPGQSIDVVPGLLALTHVRNPGAAFGLLAGAASVWRDLFLIAVGLAAVVGLGWLLLSLPRERRWQRLAVAGVIGGAIGNLIDRLTYGQVIDFVDAYFRGWHWPAFNVADSCISVGVVVLVVATVLTSESKETASGASKDSAPR